MSKEVAIDDVIDIMVEKLNSGGTVTFSAKGKSMLPMLRDGEDVVVLSKPDGRLHLFDIPFYKRSNGSYVLHRIVNFDADGSYVLCGDNQFVLEHGIKDSDIIGVVTAFYRKGKAYSVNSFSYRLYVNFWFYTRFFRHSYRFGTNKVSKLFGKGNKKSDEKTVE
ncbi:S24/S26 family peptidase [uncultured Ruminococcus sp.]|uniref:S24/S26 family peptidase n=1 Tax=uncultured Ruminococcus sp. TaxID=165186 RepID=UPI0025FDAB32|nr:S24/S26 family peptidase [uncultured Ruminococcus sp.]